MKPIGIPFKGPMVRAILDGRKTQTRRVVDMRDINHIGPGGSDTPDDWGCWVESDGVGGWAVLARGYDRLHEQNGCVSIPAPYGPVGRELWVRETWQVATGAMRGDLGAAVRYRDMEIKPCWMPAEKPLPLGLTWNRWRPSLFMPRWASRISLTVTGVRVERLQDISEEDALAEGVEASPTETPREAYARLWGEINGAGSWAANPWVWVYTFQRKGGV